MKIGITGSSIELKKRRHLECSPECCLRRWKKISEGKNFCVTHFDLPVWFLEGIWVRWAMEMQFDLFVSDVLELLIVRIVLFYYLYYYIFYYYNHSLKITDTTNKRYLTIGISSVENQIEEGKTIWMFLVLGECWMLRSNECCHLLLHLPSSCCLFLR